MHALAAYKARLVRRLPASSALGSGRALRIAIEFATTAYLMRVLGPSPFGLVAMATGLMVAFSVFKDAGAGSSLVSDPELSPGKTGAALLVSGAMGVATMLVSLACTPLVVRFYGEPQLALIWIVVSVALLVTALSSVPASLIQRQQRFWLMGWIPLLSSVVAAAAALLLLRWRHDFWPVLIFQVVGSLSGLVLMWAWLRPEIGRPSRQHVREVFHFGRGLVGFDALNVLNRYADNVIVGFFLGSHALGLYLLAYKALMMPLREIGGVVGGIAYPRLSRLAPDWAQVGLGLAEVMRDVAIFSTPLCLGIAVAAPELIDVVFGEAWRGALVPLQVLALLGVMQTPFSQTGLAYTVSRQTGQMARWGALSTPAIVCSFVAGIPWGIEGVAIAYACTSLALLLPLLRISASVLSVSPWVLARGGFAGIGIGALLALPLLITYGLARQAGMTPLTVLVLTIAVGAVSELGAYMVSIRRRRRRPAAW